jgi:hypothetical protein
MFGFPSKVFGFGSLHPSNRFDSQAEKFREGDSDQEQCDLVIFASDRILVDREPIINRAHETITHSGTTRQSALPAGEPARRVSRVAQFPPLRELRGKLSSGDEDTACQYLVSGAAK